MYKLYQMKGLRTKRRNIKLIQIIRVKHCNGVLFDLKSFNGEDWGCGRWIYESCITDTVPPIYHIYTSRHSRYMLCPATPKTFLCLPHSYTILPQESFR